AVGQLPNITGSGGSSGNLAHMITAWGSGVAQTNPLAVMFALGTIIIVVGLRHVDRRIPGSIIAMVISIGIGTVVHAYVHKLQLLAELAPIPAGLPPFMVPSLWHWAALAPAAVACAVLSLVESSSVARALTSRSGQRLDMAAEFAGQGLANIAAAFFG